MLHGRSVRLHSPLRRRRRQVTITRIQRRIAMALGFKYEFDFSSESVHLYLVFTYLIITLHNQNTVLKITAFYDPLIKIPPPFVASPGTANNAC